MNDREQWLLIFQHHLEEENDLFTEDEVLSCNTVNKLSLLKKTETFRRYFRIHGKFYFKLEYPNIEKTNIWSQTLFPTLAESNSDVGYENLGCDITNNKWGGLAKSNASQTFIDGSPNHSTWYYAIGQLKQFANEYKLPDPRYENGIEDYHYLTDVRLWIKAIINRSLTTNYFINISFIFVIILLK